jgi:hypothetical protein
MSSDPAQSPHDCCEPRAWPAGAGWSELRRRARGTAGGRAGRRCVRRTQCRTLDVRAARTTIPRWKPRPLARRAIRRAFAGCGRNAIPHRGPCSRLATNACRHAAPIPKRARGARFMYSHRQQSGQRAPSSQRRRACAMRPPTSPVAKRACLAHAEGGAALSAREMRQHFTSHGGRALREYQKEAEIEKKPRTPCPIRILAPIAARAGDA